jgi:sialate O-acetylesterase
VVTDLIDSVTNIHPSNKRDVGFRLANWALGETYNKSTSPYKSPMYDRAEVSGGKLVIYCKNAPHGLMAKGKAITGFLVAGEDGQWLPADAKIDGEKIIVWNKKIRQPVNARYGFSNTLVGNVFSTENLPLCPFRTDSFPVDQSAVKN